MTSPSLDDEIGCGEDLPGFPTHHRIILGDARHMSRVEDESVELVVTSPPYWTIKDYGPSGQIGYGTSLAEYYSDLSMVWSECIRALRPGCRLCINVGDQYLRAGEESPYQIVPIHANIVNGLMACSRGEMVYLGSIIWQKISNTRTSGGGSVMGSFGFPRNGYLSLDYEYIAIFKKKGEGPPVAREIKEKSRIDIESWRTLFNGHWRFPGARQENHVAVFPERLPYRLIRMFTFPGDTVLDPFLGSGTTTKVARAMKRHSVGYEIGFKTKDGQGFRDVIMDKIGVSLTLDSIAADRVEVVDLDLIPELAA